MPAFIIAVAAAARAFFRSLAIPLEMCWRCGSKSPYQATTVPTDA